VGAKWVRRADSTVASVPSASPAPPVAKFPFDSAQASAHQDAWARNLGVPVEYTNSIGMKFRLIPPGEFMMGFDPAVMDELVRLKVFTDKDPSSEYLQAAMPRHQVRITRPFYIQIDEMQVGWYREIMGQLPEGELPGGTSADDPHAPVASYISKPD